MENKTISKPIFVYTCSLCGYSVTSEDKLNTITKKCSVCKRECIFYETKDEISVICQYCPICKDYFPMMQHLSDIFKFRK